MDALDEEIARAAGRAGMSPHDLLRARARRTATVNFRITAVERAALDSAAAQAGQCLTAWCREQLLDAAARRTAPEELIASALRKEVVALKMQIENARRALGEPLP